MGSFAFKLCDVADVLEFSLCLTLVLSILTTETTKDVTGLSVAANLDEPSRRFGEEEDENE